MTTILNYLLEANLTLIVAIAFYCTFLKKETRFGIMRAYLLLSIVAALALPLIDFSTGGTPVPSLSLSIGQVIPSYWLPEVTAGDTPGVMRASSYTVWTYATIVYLTGLGIFLLLFLRQLCPLWRIAKQPAVRVGKLRIIESHEDIATFSFFRLVVIGRANRLTPAEKEHIIRHERVHAEQLHSLDMLLVHLLKVIFWFNPLVNTYQRAFIQLHEFEADAHAVQHSDVNTYCKLLARMALQSANVTLANHFNHSLTVKRIEMLKKLKHNMMWWRVVAVSSVVPLLFFVVACHDQVAQEIKSIADHSGNALMAPDDIQARVEALRARHPDRTYSVLQLDEQATGRLRALEEQYGLPSYIIVYQTVDGKITGEGIQGSQERAVRLQKELLSRPPDRQTFAIVEHNGGTANLSESAAQDKIYTVVEQLPTFPGGYDSLVNFVQRNMRYPQASAQGTVYVRFIVRKDGSITNTEIVRGISAEHDLEAKRVVESFPKWIPGKQSGQAVNVSFVLPVRFIRTQ